MNTNSLHAGARRERRRLIQNLGLAGLALSLPGWVSAETFPSGPIRLLVPFPPGGTSDVLARLHAESMGRLLGQSVVVDNRGGAGGVIGANEARRARADGHTLILHSSSSGVTAPLAQPPVPFDPVQDFSHIGVLGVTPLVLAVNPRLPVGSLKDLVALVRANPGKYSYGSSGVGGGPHLSAELLKLRANLPDLVHVAYRGTGPAIQDTIAGHVAFVIDTFGTLLPLHQSGQLRILSVLGEQRADVTPNIHTAVEEGFDLVSINANYISAPPATPAARIERLAATLRDVSASPVIQKRLRELGYEPVAHSTPELTTQLVAKQKALWLPVIQSINTPR